MSDMTHLEHSIYRTVYWFSMFNYPLTSFEIWKWLYNPSGAYDYDEIYKALDESEILTDKLNYQDGYYSISEKDISDLIASRHNGFLDAVRKFKKLKRAARLLGLIPGVRAVGAANNLSWWNKTK